MGTDFIQDWKEDVQLKDHFKELFKERAPWDEDGKYRLDTIEVYFEGNCTTPLDPKDKSKDSCNKKYIKCDLKDTILDVLRHPFNIVP